MALLASTIVFVVLAGVGRLMMGPVPVSFVQPTLERELNRQLPGYEIEFDRTVIDWRGWRRGLDILATNVVLKDARGLTVVELPELAVGLKATALVRGQVSPHRIDLFAPVISLSRRADGTFGFKRDDTTSNASTVRTEELLAILLSPQDETAAGLNQLIIEDATIVVGDLAQRQDWQIDNATLDIRRTADGLRATLDGTLTAGDQVVGLALAADYSRFTERVALGVDVVNATPSILARPVGPLEQLKGWNVPVTGSLLLNADLTGRVDRISFDLAAAKGELELDLWPSPQVLDGATVKAVLDRNSGRLDVTEAELLLGGGSISGAAVFAATNAGIMIEAEADVDRLPFRRLAAIWPPDLKTNARRWFATNVTAGRIMGGKVDLTIVPDTDGGGTTEDFRFTFGFQGMELHYIRPMPPLSAASGTAVLTPGAFEVRVEDGQIVDADTDLSIDVTSVYAFMSPLDLPVTHTADVTLTFSAGAKDIVTLIDYEPLGYATDYGISRDSLDGDARVQGRFEFPLVDDLDIDDVAFRVAGKIERLDLVDAPDYVRQVPGNVSMVVVRDELRAKGQLYLWDNPIDVTWTENFRALDGLPTRYHASGVLPAARLYDLGLPEGVEISTPLPFDVHLTGDGTDIATGEAMLDLTEMAIELPAIGWGKDAQAPGSISFGLSTQNGWLRPDNVVASAPGLSVRGRLLFDEDGAALGAEFSPFTVGETNLDMAAYFTEADILDLRLTGPQLDLRPFLDDDEEEDVDEEEGTFDAVITVGVASALGASGLVINDVGGLIRLEDSAFEEAQLSGSFPSGETLFIDYHPIGNHRSLSVQTDNAGGLVRALDLFDGAVGGGLSLEATVDGPEDNRRTTGTLDVRKFKITGAPGLARLLTLGSLTGIVDTLSGEGLSFDRLESGFVHQDGTLTINKTQAVGSQLGIRFDGRAFDDLQKLDIRGTLAPAYTLNTALNYVPLVGSILSGGSGEGLFAMRFSVSGDMDDPDVSVNPLSALTPGILRGVFDVFDPPSRGPEQAEPVSAPADTGSPSESMTE